MASSVIVDIKKMLGTATLTPESRPVAAQCDSCSYHNGILRASHLHLLRRSSKFVANATKHMLERQHIKILYNINNIISLQFK